MVTAAVFINVAVHSAELQFETDLYLLTLQNGPLWPNFVTEAVFASDTRKALD
jgi:hypothetical protein